MPPGRDNSSPLFDIWNITDDEEDTVPPHPNPADQEHARNSDAPEDNQPESSSSLQPGSSSSMLLPWSSSSILQPRSSLSAQQPGSSIQEPVSLEDDDGSSEESSPEPDTNALLNDEWILEHIADLGDLIEDGELISIKISHDQGDKILSLPEGIFKKESGISVYVTYEESHSTVLANVRNQEDYISFVNFVNKSH